MSRPNVGDLIILHENGAEYLAIVTAHTPNNRIDVHSFTTSHFGLHPSQYHPLIPEQEGKGKKS